MIELLLDIYGKLLQHFNENTQEGGVILFFTFVLGNFLIASVAAAMCFLTKKIKIIYDFFGFILASSLIAIFANMVLLMPFVFLQLKARNMFYLGCLVTAGCCFVIAYHFHSLNSMGQAYKK
ncbi:hypothetical protein [Aequorivita capsosiphonis]|uniref:hypothetical protein n=1 Tax=Aequorivita capsosiphonis TaxID=487317 RepID=UPI00047C329B|nr:hypothetical protein [Aequorivita capsosiphonis]